MKEQTLALNTGQRRKLARLTRRASPREACAFLLGSSTDGRHVVSSIVVVRNTHRGRHSFGISPGAVRQLPAAPIALFHSHAHDLAPSLADLKVFDRMPQLRCQLIGAIENGRLRLRAFDPLNHSVAITPS